MKKETTGKKSKLWLIIAIAVVAVLAVAGVILALTLGGGQEPGSDPVETIESKLYWNIDREAMVDKETMLTLREPAADGLYYIRFAVDGQQVELPCADKKLVNKIDFEDVVGLKFDADGIIVDMYHSRDVATVIADNAYVQNVNGSTITTNSSKTLNGMEQDVDLSNANIYIVEDPRPEVPGRDFTIGAKDEVKLMDTVLIFGSDENTAHTVYVTERLYDSKVYWRAEAAQFNSTTKVSTRQQAKDGYWYMDFLCEGEIVTVRTKSESCINAMDGYNIMACGCGIVFDTNGDVVDVFNAGLAVKGKVAVNNYDVTAIDGNMVTLTRKLSGTEQGRTYMLNVTDDLPVYNVTTTADKFGERTEFRMGDRVYLLADASGKPVQAYLTCRLVDSPMYYNISRSYSSTLKETQRKPDENGWYTIKLAVDGKEKTFRCKDKELVNQIDAYGMLVFGLKLKGDRIVKAYNPECVTGAYSFAANNWVTTVAGDIVGTQTAAGVAVNGVMDVNCEVYDVSGCSSFKGAKATLREGDRIIAYNTPDATMRYIYIISRKVSGTSLYWNFEKKYDAVKQQTTRTKDDDGYYVFKMAKAGKAGEVFLKTKDIEIANRIDKTGVYAMTLKVSNGVIKGAYPAPAINGGYIHVSGIYVQGMTADGRLHAKFYTTGAEGRFDISEATFYNVTDVYKKGVGEVTTPKPGDRLLPIYNSNGKMEHVFVYERESGSSAYWQFNPNYNSTAKTTEPDENGYYNYKVTVGGKVKTVRTKDKELAAAMDAKFMAFGLKLKGDIIQGVYKAGSTKEIAASAQSYYDVAKIKGNKITLERTVPGSSNTGDVQEIDISKAKVYNVSAYAGDAWGKAAKLGIGDRVQTYKNEKGEITLVYIIWENTHEAGHKSYCEHCKKEVVWHPYFGTIDAIDKHYYLTHDYETYYSKGWGWAGATRGFDWVLDLNGHTYKATGSYAFAVRGNSTLTVVDTSKAKTGRITGVGVQIKDAEGNMSKYQSSQAGIFQVLDNGTLNLRGGTYTRTVNREITNLRRAGVAFVNPTGTLNIYDGAKLVNNTIDTPLDLTASEPIREIYRNPQGGAIYNAGGVVNIHGGLISNNGKIHEDYKDVESTAIGYGGNIFNASGELNIYGGKITGGWSRGEGGNIYISSGKLTIAGGEITGGTSVKNANNIFVPADRSAEVNITGGKITGDFTISEGNTLKISGKPVISMGEKQGLFLGEGVKAKVGTMTDGAKIVLSSTGTFTTDFATKAAAEAILAKKYFVGESSLTPFYVEGKALACGKKACLNGHTTKDQCDAANCDEELLSWTPWTASDSLPTYGNYYLTKNVTVDAKTTVSDKLVLDLNGFNVTRNVTEQQITEGISTYVFEIPAGKKLTVADLSGKTESGTVKVVQPKDGSNATIPVTTTYGMVYVATGSEVEIYNGIFDGKDMLTANVNAGGIFCGGGKLTIHGGEFYGWSHKDGASGGIGSVFGGWSTSVLTINGGTFYGGKVKQGGMFATNGKIVINDGVFNGNNSATNSTIDAAKPRTEVTHGGLIYAINHANSYVEINGGTFTAARTHNSGGIIYTDSGNSVVKITGGTFQLSQAGNGGFIRFRGKTLDITGVTLSGGKAATGDNIAFNSSGTLTIGKDAVINGGIQMVPVGTTTKLVLKDNVKIGAGTNYAIELSGAKLDISGLNDDAKVYINHTSTATAFAVAADEATAKKLVDNKIIVSADSNYRVVNDGANLTVQAQILWTDWTSDNSLPTDSGNYRLTKPVTISSTYTIAKDKDVKLNFNGFTVTRDIKAADAAASEFYKMTAGSKLYLTDEVQLDDPAKKVGGMVLTSENNVAVSGSYGVVNVADGSEVTVENGIFDGRNVKFSGTATHGLFCGSGKLTINGGTFYGMSGTGGAASGGDGSVWGGWSASKLYINGGTFYGGNVKQGGLFTTTGLIHITDGIFNGNNSATNTIIDATQPRTVATHGGLIYMASHANSRLIIEGGTFIAPYCYNSGGMIYTGSNLNTVEITGGTFQLSKATTGGFIRFRGSNLTIQGVTLTGGSATNGNHISFEGTGTLTIGQDAIINGGIRAISGKVLLKDNAKVNYAGNSSYSLKLQNTSVYVGATTNAAAVTVGGTAKDYVATYNPNGNVTGVTAG